MSLMSIQYIERDSKERIEKVETWVYKLKMRVTFILKSYKAEHSWMNQLYL
jgi:hypothetical protein